MMWLILAVVSVCLVLALRKVRQNRQNAEDLAAFEAKAVAAAKVREAKAAAKEADRIARKKKYEETLATFRAFAKSGCNVCFGKGYRTAVMNDTGERTDMQCRCSYKNMQRAVGDVSCEK